MAWDRSRLRGVAEDQLAFAASRELERIPEKRACKIRKVGARAGTYFNDQSDFFTNPNVVEVVNIYRPLFIGLTRHIKRPIRFQNRAIYNNLPSRLTSSNLPPHQGTALGFFFFCAVEQLNGARWPSERPFCAILMYASPRVTKACELIGMRLVFPWSTASLGGFP